MGDKYENRENRAYAFSGGCADHECTFWLSGPTISTKLVFCRVLLYNNQIFYNETFRETGTTGTL